jgi:integrase
VCGINGLRNAIKKRGTQIGLPELAPHDLRRTFAGRLEDNDVPLRTIQPALRHSSVATTDRYLADNPNRWREDISQRLRTSEPSAERHDGARRTDPRADGGRSRNWTTQCGS